MTHLMQKIERKLPGNIIIIYRTEIKSCDNIIFALLFSCELDILKFYLN